MMSAIRSFLIMTLILGLILTGCSAGRRAIQVKGSDTMVNLAQAWTAAAPAPALPRLSTAPLISLSAPGR
jgi:ABC-type phosphate transport system substrate-binding protein